MKTARTQVIAGALLQAFFVTGAMGQTAPATAAAPAPSSLRVGFDERIRLEAFDHLPTPGPAGEYEYFRFRTRMWLEADPCPNATFRIRLANESRIWNEPDVSARPNYATYDMVDETVIDNLYLEMRNLLDQTLDLRIGRQDFMDRGAPAFGNGRVLVDGTPEDGSRTLYFNAIRATWKGLPETTVDALAMYQFAEDNLAINSVHRDLTGFTSAVDDMPESGGGFYLKNKSAAACPVEVYFLYKNEGSWDQAVTSTAVLKAWQTAVTTTKVHNAPSNLWTPGFRIAPEFAPGLKGSLEMAYQFGQRGDADISALMAEALLSYALPVGDRLAPTLNAGAYYMSGDDATTGDDEGWDPLWSRAATYNEIYAVIFPRGRWSNILAPNAGVSFSPILDAKRMKLTANIAYLLAPEDDGDGPGDERGWLETVKLECLVAEGLLFRDARKDRLAAHLWLELLQPGDYSASDEDAYFARAEMTYSF
jgi:hypothetical protein